MHIEYPNFDIKFVIYQFQMTLIFKLNRKIKIFYIEATEEILIYLFNFLAFIKIYNSINVLTI